MIQPGRPRARTTSGRLAALLVSLSILAAACGTNAPVSTSLPTLGPLPTVAPSSAPSAPSGAPTGVASPSGAPSSAPSAAPSSSPSGAPSPAPSGSTAGSPGTGALAWTDCGAPFQCATLQVPLDYTHPDGKKISLSLIRLPSSGSASQKIGSLLTNPGGPGGSGIDYLRGAGETLYSSALRARFDLVSWDPRGVAASTPVECVDGPTYDKFYHDDPSPDTDAEKQILIASSKEFDAACEAHSGELLPFMTTTDSARDMEQIRIALGEPKLSYLGFSYGTFLGTVYAGLYPDRIRAFALDGALDPATSADDLAIQQALGFEKALDTFLDDCSNDTSCAFNNNGKAGDAFDALMKQIDEKPLPAAASGDPRTVGPGEADTAVAYALYSRSLWNSLAQGLALAQRGDGSVLLLLSDSYYGRQPDGSYSNEFAAFFSVTCADHVFSTDPAHADEVAAKLIPQAPRLGASFAYGTLGFACTYWPVRPTKDYGAITAAGAPPILVVGTTGDPATPYQWAVNLSKELASGVLLTRKGEGHTGYSDSACIQQKVDTYLLTLQTPPPNTVCDP